MVAADRLEALSVGPLDCPAYLWRHERSTAEADKVYLVGFMGAGKTSVAACARAPARCARSLSTR